MQQRISSAPAAGPMKATYGQRERLGDSSRGTQAHIAGLAIFLVSVASIVVLVYIVGQFVATTLTHALAF